MAPVKRLRPLNRRPHVFTVRLSPTERELLLASRRTDENVSDTLRRFVLAGAAREKPRKTVENALEKQAR